MLRTTGCGRPRVIHRPHHDVLSLVGRQQLSGRRAKAASSPHQLESTAP